MFPVSIKDINVFEMNNDISVNVLSVEDKNVYICRKGHRAEGRREVNLMLISEDGLWHYTVIQSLSRLLTNRNTKHRCKQYFCTNCLQGFTLESSRDQHCSYCINNEMVREEMPSKGSTVEFYDRQNQFRVQFMMYADFESILMPIQGPAPDPSEAYINEVNKHIPSGWCIYSKFAYEDVKDPLTIYRGEDCIKRFCDHIMNEVIRLYHMFPEKPMDPLTNRQWKSYKRSRECHICYKPFNGFDPKVGDHCHYTGPYRGPAHRNCNLRYRIPHYIPVIFHNLLGYDAHLFIKELGARSSNIGVIAKNKEDYITFSVKVAVDRYMDKNGDERDKTIELRLIDSFKFMESSLDSMTSNLVQSSRKLFGFEDYSESQYNLLTRKGIYPYEYMSSWDKLEESQLPPTDLFIAISTCLMIVRAIMNMCREFGSSLEFVT